MRDFVNVDKTPVFYSKEDWDKWKKDRDKHYKKMTYFKYSVNTEPEHFPCIGIEISVPEGDLGTNTTVEMFICPCDFCV